jgi:hypothetical protein
VVILPKVWSRQGVWRENDRVCTGRAVALLVTAILFWGWGIAATPALALPDGRVYELVSPVQKSGGTGGVFPLGELVFQGEQVGRPLQSSASGSSIAYDGEDFYEPRLGSLNEYLSSLDGTDWATSNLTPGVPSTSETAIEANTYLGFAPDLSVGVISGKAPLSEDSAVPPHYANLYVADRQGARAVIETTPPNRSAAQFGWAHSHAGGGEVLFSHLFFGGGNSGTATVPAFSHILFAANDALTPNAVDGGKLTDNLYEWEDGQVQLVNVLPGGATAPNASFGVDHNDEFVNKPLPNLSHAISADGSRIFWTDQNSGDLYVREDGERTMQVDASVGGGGEYQTASVDGSRVFFTKEGRLYEYQTETEVEHDLTPPGGVQGVLGASDDGTSVYFVATSELAPGGKAGQPNLYMSNGGALTFVKTLAPDDNHTPNLYGSGATAGDWYRTFAGRTARVSPNGRYVAFMSNLSMPGYDNTDTVSHNRDYEVFLYDSAMGTLACASCNTNGSRPTSDTLLPAPINGFYQQRYLDDSGQLFFSTADAVLPQDANRLSDVYEYENGHVYLISPGNAEDEAVFADASESGNDVFFTTNQPLVSADQDRIVDLYDARVGGRTEAPPPPTCSDEGCLGLPASPPPAEAPITAIFSGAGNLIPPAPVAVPRAKKPAAKRKSFVKQGKHNGHHVRRHRRVGRALRRGRTSR